MRLFQSSVRLKKLIPTAHSTVSHNPINVNALTVESLPQDKSKIVVMIVVQNLGLVNVYYI